MWPIRSFDGMTPALGERVYIDPQACVIGRVSLGNDVSVWPMAVVRGDMEAITVGDRVNVQDGAVLHVSHNGPHAPGGRSLTIGADTTISHRAMVHGCTIGERCLIGMGSIVMDGVTIGDDVIVGAGSVVPPNKHLPSGTVWMGAPAHQARVATAEEIKLNLYLATHYVAVKNRYLKAALA